MTHLLVNSIFTFAFCGIKLSICNLSTGATSTVAREDFTFFGIGNIEHHVHKVVMNNNNNQPPQQNPVNDIRQWYFSLPLVPRALLTATVVVSIAGNFMISPLNFVFHSKSITSKLQVRRPLVHSY